MDSLNKEHTASARESLNIQALQDRAVALWEVDKTSALELGKALVDVRDAMRSHGDFAQWWRDAGMDENRVYYCIRLAEGKVKPKAPRPEPIFLNQRNLALWRLTPKKGSSCFMHVGPDGITATDGVILARVSLPRIETPGGRKINHPPTTQSGLLPADFAQRLLSDTGDYPAQIAFRKDKVNAIVGKNLELSAPVLEGVFPQTKNVIAEQAATPVLAQIPINPSILKRLVESICDFAGDNRVQITISDGGGADGFGVFRCDAERDGQTMFAMMRYRDVDYRRTRLKHSYDSLSRRFPDDEPAFAQAEAPLQEDANDDLGADEQHLEAV